MSNKAKKHIKRLVIVIGILLVIIAGFTILDKRPTYADSGFSTSHSGGGSSDDGDDLIGFLIGLVLEFAIETGNYGLILIIIVIIIIAKIYGKIKPKSDKVPLHTPNMNINETSIENKIKQYIPNFNKYEFLNNGYKMYCNIQEAWMNFELDKVRGSLTDELFTMYESQLATLEVKGEKNIMKDFVLKSSNLKDVTEQNGTITITTNYVIEFYDYIADANTGGKIRGVSDRKMRVMYEMKFRKTLSENAKIKNCPNCGAPVDVNSAGVCKYCNSKIVAENTEWVLTEKKTVTQEYI